MELREVAVSQDEFTTMLAIGLIDETGALTEHGRQTVFGSVMPSWNNVYRVKERVS